MALGDAFIDVHADTDPFEREIGPKLKAASADADKILIIAGKQWGKDLADSTSDELGKHGKDFGRSIEKATEKIKVKVKSDFTIDRNGRLHDAAGRFAKMFEEETVRAFASAAGPGGPFSKIGEGLSDAIGAGFNVSGKSPLISVLGVGVGALIGLILAAVQAVNALIAVLAAVPALLTAIGLQAGVLFLAFKGVGGAVQKAFAAKNATELNDALKGLTPSAQKFVTSLLPLRPLFENLQRVVQSKFFKALGDTVSRVASSLLPLLTPGLGRLAASLGTFFSGLGIFFSSPAFKDFIKDVIPATTAWLQTFGLGFLEFLRVLITMADATLPFLTRLGDILNNAMHTFSSWLDDQLKSGDFQSWLADMGDTLEAVVELFFKATEFVATFLAQLNNAGGTSIIDALSDSLEQLTFFLASPAGAEFFDALVKGSILFIKATTGLIELLFALIAAVSIAIEHIGPFFTWFAEGWKQVWEGAKKEMSDFWLLLQAGWLAVKATVMGFINWFINGWRQTWNGARQEVSGFFNAIIATIKSIPGRIVAILSSIVGALINIGRNAANGLMNALIGGIRGAGAELGRAMGEVVGRVAGLLPGSPAKEGPLSGRGYVKLRGQRMIHDFAAGISAGTPDLRMASMTAMQQVAFGDVNLNFRGALPTDNQARNLGAAAMNGIESQLARRTIRLAVRTAA